MKVFLKIVGIVLASILAFFIIAFASIIIYLNHVSPVEIRQIGEYVSPDKKHVCSVIVTNGGATTPYTVVGQIRGTWIIGSRTVYAVDNIEEATVRWVNNRTVRINGVKLDIYRDQYVGDIYDLKGD